LKDIWPGSQSSGPRSIAIVDGTLFFRAMDPIHHFALWKTDGTRAGTVMVKDM